MKKRIAMLIPLLLLMFIPFSLNVFAGSINSYEAEVISEASGTFEYLGDTYVAADEYILQLEEYLASDDVDLNKAQAEKAIAAMYESIGKGVTEGYLIKVDEGDSSASQSDEGNSESSEADESGKNDVEITSTGSEEPTPKHNEGNSYENGDVEEYGQKSSSSAYAGENAVDASNSSSNNSAENSEYIAEDSTDSLSKSEESELNTQKAPRLLDSKDILVLSIVAIALIGLVATGISLRKNKRR